MEGRSEPPASVARASPTAKRGRRALTKATQLAPPPTPRPPLDPVSEQYSPGGTASDAYSPFVDSAASTMEVAAAAAAFDAFTAAAVKGVSESELVQSCSQSRTGRESSLYLEV